MARVRVNFTAAGLVALALCAGVEAAGTCREPTGTRGWTRASHLARPLASSLGRPQASPLGRPRASIRRVATEQGLIPTPIGHGPEFRPAARVPAAGCAPGALSGRYRAHVEVFGRGQAVVIPAAIGVAADARREYGRVIDADCRADARTLDPSGVVHFDRDDLRLADLFAVWGSRSAGRGCSRSAARCPRSSAAGA